MNSNNKNGWQRKKKRVQTTLDDYIKSNTKNKKIPFGIEKSAKIIALTPDKKKNESVKPDETKDIHNEYIVDLVSSEEDLPLPQSKVETCIQNSVEEIVLTPKNKNESIQFEESMSPVFSNRFVRRKLNSNRRSPINNYKISRPTKSLKSSPTKNFEDSPIKSLKASPMNNFERSPVKNFKTSPINKHKVSTTSVNEDFRRNLYSDISPDDSILNDSYHRPEKRQSPTKFKYKSDVVRKKDERKKLCGYACACCKDYFDALDLTPNERERRMKFVSRHRDREAPPSTPEGFWDLDMPDTPELIARKERLYSVQKQPKKR